MPDSEADRKAWLESHEQGYAKGLKPRQVRMIAISGAIGTGLFLGAANGWAKPDRHWRWCIWSAGCSRF